MAFQQDTKSTVHVWNSATVTFWISCTGDVIEDGLITNEGSSESVPIPQTTIELSEEQFQ